MIHINISIEDKDAERKVATGMTWKEIIELGIKTAEEQQIINNYPFS